MRGWRRRSWRRRDGKRLSSHGEGRRRIRTVPQLSRRRWQLARVRTKKKRVVGKIWEGGRRRRRSMDIRAKGQMLEGDECTVDYMGIWVYGNYENMG